MKAIATEESIRDAYKKLKADGVEPTVENIRNLIHGGSNSTIHKILSSIEEEEVDTVVCSEDPDEDALIKDHAISVIHGLYQKCKKRAEELAIAQYRRYANADEELNNKIKRLDEIEEQAGYKVSAAEAKREEAIAKVEVIVSKLQSVEKELKQKEEEITALNQQIKELKQAQQQQLHINEMLQHTNEMLQEILTQMHTQKSGSTRTKKSSKQEKKEL